MHVIQTIIINICRCKVILYIYKILYNKNIINIYNIIVDVFGSVVINKNILLQPIIVNILRFQVAYKF